MFHNAKTITQKIRNTTKMLSGLQNNCRLALDLLMDNGGEMTVTEIMIKLRNYDQSQVSGMLAHLRRYGIANCRRKGKNMMYSVNYDKIEKINAFTKAINTFTPTTRYDV